jgi:hypothetical protein
VPRAHRVLAHNLRAARLIARASTPTHSTLVRVAGGPYPAAGLTLLVQVKVGRRWETFDQLLTHNGRFAYSYTFLRTSTTTTYAFRVALPVSGAADYDYLPSDSRTISIKVFP